MYVYNMYRHWRGHFVRRQNASSKRRRDTTSRYILYIYLSNHMYIFIWEKHIVTIQCIVIYIYNYKSEKKERHKKCE